MKRIHLGVTKGKSYYFFKDYTIFPSNTINNLNECLYFGWQGDIEYKKIRSVVSISNTNSIFSNKKMRFIKFFK